MRIRMKMLMIMTMLHLAKRDKFWQRENLDDGRFRQHGNFNHKRIRKDLGFCYGLDINLRSIKMKMLAF